MRVLDLTRLLPFAYGTQLLADLGAEVVKLEQPGGEVGRSYVNQYRATNHGKQSVTVDLRDEADRDLVLELVAGADVIVESFRPGFLESLGLGYHDLVESCPEIVMCSVTGYAATGPLASRPGHDLNYLAVAGALGAGAAGPVPPPLPIADMATGHHMAYCITAALLARAQGAGGCHVRIAMTEVAASLATPLIASSLGGDPEERPTSDLLSGHYPCYRLWPTADDGWVALCNLEPKFWRAFLEVIDRLDLLDDQFAVGSRGAVVTSELAEIMRARTRSEWDVAFADADCCYSPVLDPDGLATSPELGSSQMVRLLPGSAEVRFPGTFSGQRPERSTVLAEPGQDDDSQVATAARSKGGGVGRH